jgi:hypothetical protein
MGKLSVDGYTGFYRQSTLPFILPEGVAWTIGRLAEDSDL